MFETDDVRLAKYEHVLLCGAAEEENVFGKKTLVNDVAQMKVVYA
jgi:hypothetical protein